MKVTIEIDSDSLIDALTPGDARRLRAKLGIANTALTVYGSKAPYAPPPGRSYRWFLEHAPTMPGAERSGGKRGRSVLWTIGAEAYAGCVLFLRGREAIVRLTEGTPRYACFWYSELEHLGPSG